MVSKRHFSTVPSSYLALRVMVSGGVVNLACLFLYSGISALLNALFYSLYSIHLLAVKS